MLGMPESWKKAKSWRYGWRERLCVLQIAQPGRRSYSRPLQPSWFYYELQMLTMELQNLMSVMLRFGLIIPCFALIFCFRIGMFTRYYCIFTLVWTWNVPHRLLCLNIGPQLLEKVVKLLTSRLLRGKVCHWGKALKFNSLNSLSFWTADEIFSYHK